MVQKGDLVTKPIIIKYGSTYSRDRHEKLTSHFYKP